MPYFETYEEALKYAEEHWGFTRKFLDLPPPELHIYDLSIIGYSAEERLRGGYWVSPVKK